MGFLKAIKKVLAAFCLANFYVLSLFAGAENETLLSRLVPQPKEAEFKEEIFYTIKSGAKTEISTAVFFDEKPHLEAEFLKMWKTAPSLSYLQNASLSAIADDAYEIKISADAMSIFAKNAGGVFQALKTLRQLAEPARAAAKTDGYILPACVIKDWPSLNFRAVHICVFPETRFEELQKKVMLAAYYKFNYAVIEFWGCFPSATHPELFWPAADYTKGDITKLASEARQNGITLIPQMSVLGHASGSFFRSGKHCALDLNPDLQPLFEPTGWSWCLSNPETKKVLTETLFEMHDAFLRPPFFHIGCDEAFDLASCAACRRADLAELLASHIMFFYDAFKLRKTRVMMWHDMLVEREDPRFKGSNANAKKSQGLAEFYKRIPKDVLICDWEYNFDAKASPEALWPVAKFFKTEGFDVILCSWRNAKGTYAQGQSASAEEFFGLMSTIWGKAYGQDFQYIFLQGAAAAWGAPSPNLDAEDAHLKRLNFDLHLRQIGWDLGLKGYEQTGTSRMQYVEDSVY